MKSTIELLKDKVQIIYDFIINVTTEQSKKRAELILILDCCSW